jgi:hypothetical protein
MASIIVWDIETVPDLKGFAAASGHGGSSSDEIRAAMGDKIPKHIYHCPRGRTSIGTRKTPLISAMSCPHSAPRAR